MTRRVWKFKPLKARGKKCRSCPTISVVNIGDMMQHWTGGRYASTVHRVVNRTDHTRHAIAYFFDPDPDADLSALPGCGTPPIPATDGAGAFAGQNR
jgi:isopenicillin N synthase-like dioxygenase